MDFHFWEGWHPYPMGVFTFVILIILINGLFHWLREKSKQETLREAIKSGVKLEPDALKEISVSTGENSRTNRLLVGLILIAVAGALVFFGYQVGKASGDDEVFPIFQGIAAFPGLIGIVFLALSPFGKKGGQDGLED